MLWHSPIWAIGKCSPFLAKHYWVFKYWVSSKLTTSRIQTLKTQIHLTDILKELRRKMLYTMEHITYRGVYINNNYLYIYIIYIFSIL